MQSKVSPAERKKTTVKTTTEKSNKHALIISIIFIIFLFIVFLCELARTSALFLPIIIAYFIM